MNLEEFRRHRRELPRVDFDDCECTEPQRVAEVRADMRETLIDQMAAVWAEEFTNEALWAWLDEDDAS
jgi:hypothetical protein